MQHNTLKGVGYILFSIVIWAGWVVVSRMAVKGSLSPYDVTAIRFTTAGLLLLPIAIKKSLRIGPWGLWSGFLLSVTIGAAYTNIATAGMLFAPASHASTIINGTLLVLTTFVGIHGLREPTSPARLIGVLICIAGIICMLVAKNGASSPNQWIGHLLFILSGLLWGTYTLLVRAWKVDIIHAAAVVGVFSMITYMPFYLLFAHSHISFNNWHEVVFQSVYQGVFTGILALISFNAGIHILGASRAGAFTPLVPVLATLIAIPVLHEIPSCLEWIGVGSVAFGVFLSSGIITQKHPMQTHEQNKTEEKLS